MRIFFFKQRFWLWPLLAMAIITPFTPFLDLDITRHFYSSDKKFSTNGFYSFLYNYGVIPGQLLFIASALVFLASYIFTQWKKFRGPALTLILTLAIGSGLITHALLKDHWGRPRPKQVIEFGGTQPFRPYYMPNLFHQPEPSKSFSCGHCTMGFYFFALAFIGRRLETQTLFWIGIILGLFLGGLLSLTRIAQGGHFFSDILISALVMWLTAYICDKWTALNQGTPT